MAKKWERLSGDTSKFALRIGFSEDPDRGAFASSDDIASWGSLQIWVQERNLCATQFDGESTEAVHWYLLPFLEWVIANWNPMFHEERLPNRIAAADAQDNLLRTREAPPTFPGERQVSWEREWYDWWRRHCIDASSEGGVFPGICLRRWREGTEISWDTRSGSDRPPGVEFVQSRGVSRLQSSDVAGPMYTGVMEALDYLVNSNPESSRLRALRETSKSLSVQWEERLAWSAGFGRSIDEMKASLVSIRRTLQRVESSVIDAILGPLRGDGLVAAPFPAALMFGSVSPDISDVDRISLLRALIDAYRPKGRVDQDAFADDEPVDSEHPWEQGYQLAEDFAAKLGINEASAEPVDIEDILKRMKVSVGELRLEDDAIRGLAIGGPQYDPSILLNRTHRTYANQGGRRFTLAHELCHLLFDRAFAREVAVPSGPWAPLDVEQRANAFAAMILMPSSRLSSAIALSNAEQGSKELIYDVCTRLQTSFTATVRHMKNLAFLSEAEQDALLEEAVDSGNGRA